MVLPSSVKLSKKSIHKHRSKSKLFDLISSKNITKTINGLFYDPDYTFVVCLLLFLVEFSLNIFIVKRVKYTEIDWSTYMQQVKCFLNGELDYTKISGETGPIVYPAGHLYIFSLFYLITNHGNSIKIAQYLFIAIYMLNLAAVFRIYNRVRKIPPYGLMMMCFTSYRIHSIYSLRLFNDPIAMLFLFISINCILDRRWTLASFFFSFAVSIKMNILLFAPGLLLIFLEETNPYQTLKYLVVCALTQVTLGLPFLLTHPISYISRAFNFGRVFLYKWTVNWRFIGESLFLDKTFHLTLLALHIILLLVFFGKRYSYQLRKSRFWSGSMVSSGQSKQDKDKSSSTNQRILFTLFTCNLIGISVARSLHYQFYVWYYHSLPYLIWSTRYSTVSKLCLLGVIELCWNTYPSTDWSSGLLHLAHISLLFSLWRNNEPQNKPIKIRNK